MNVAAAIRIDSPGEARVIAHAAEFARSQDCACYVISVVPEFPPDGGDGVVSANLRLIREAGASAVIQQGDDVPRTLVIVARGFGIGILFLRAGTSPRPGRSVAERLLYLDPPFDVVLVGGD